METLKINFILYSTERTGGTRTILNYANELSDLGHEVSITALYHDPWLKLNESVNIVAKKTKLNLYRFYASTILLNKVGKTSLGSEFTLLRKLAIMTPKAEINVATYFPTAYVASWLRESATPFYLLMHDPDYFAKEPLQKRFYNDTLFLPVNKIVNSTWLKDRIYHKTNINCPVMNMGAVDLELFKPSEGKEMGSDQGEIHVVSLGKGGFKNLKFIWEAIEIVRKQNPNIKIYLHFFGHSPPSGVKLDSLTIFHKDLTDYDLAKLYSRSDIQVTSSIAESFPLPPLEAMSSGCAVITTPYGTEDYAKDGLNCLIVQPYDVNELVNQLERLILDPVLRRKIREEGLKTVRKFNYREQAKTLEGLLKLNID